MKPNQIKTEKKETTIKKNIYPALKLLGGAVLISTVLGIYGRIQYARGYEDMKQKTETLLERQISSTYSKKEYIQKDINNISFRYEPNEQPNIVRGTIIVLPKPKYRGDQRIYLLEERLDAIKESLDDLQELKQRITFNL